MDGMGTTTDVFGLLTHIRLGEQDHHSNNKGQVII